jgi:hypothetical protein
VCARADLRAGWRGWLAFVLLLAVGAGATLGGAAAARRTETAYERGLDASRAADLNVSADATVDRAAAHDLLERAVRLPGVTEAAVAGGVNVGVVHHGVLEARLESGSALGLAPEDGAYGHVVSRYRVVAGRLARSSRADEIMVTPDVAAITGWRPGERVTEVELFGADAQDDDGNPIPALGTALDLRVVAIVTVPESIVTPVDERDSRIIFTPAFTRQHRDAPFYYLASVRLARGAAGVADYRARAARLTAPSTALFVSSNSEGAVLAERADRPLVSGLWIFSAVALVVTLLLTAQLAGRQFVTNGVDQSLLRAIGVRPRQRLGILMVEAAAATLVGVTLAIVVATLASGIAPIGPAHSAEPHPGPRFDAVALGAGAVVIVILVVLAALAPAWSFARRARVIGGSVTGGEERRSTVAEGLARAGLPLSLVLGARLALQPGRGRSAVPVRSILASLVVAAAAITAVLSFRADLERMTTTPSLYGWNADAEAGTAFGSIPDDAVPELARLPHLSALSGVTLTEVSIGGRNVPAVGLDQLRGHLYVTVTNGRPADGPSEIVLGQKTLGAAHVRLNEMVTVTVGHQRHRVRVVGVATFPSMGQTRFHATSLGVGAAGTSALLPARDPGGDGTYNWLLFKYGSRDPAGDVRALRATLAAAGCPQRSCVVTDPRPQDIAGYGRATGVPAGLAGVLAALVAATVWHAVHSATRRRRLDLLVLSALGLRPRDLRGALRWQAALLVVLAAAVGIPTGIVAAHAAWAAFTHNLGVDVRPVVPVGSLALGVALAVIVAITAAALAARPLRHAAAWRSTIRAT